LLNLKYLYYGWAKNDGTNLDVLSGLSKIQGMTIFRASKLTSLPTMTKCFNFKAFCIEESHKFEDLSGLYDSPSLEALFVMDCRSLKPEAFFPFKGHPTLKHIYWGANPKDQDKVIGNLGEIWNPEMINMDYVLPEIS
jgi:hypothetical protein